MTKEIQTPNWSFLQEVGDTGRVSTRNPTGLVGDPAVWNLPATLSVQQDGNIPLRPYAANATGYTISVSGLPAGVTYNAGTESLEGASTGTDSATATFTLTLGATTVVDTATVALFEPASGFSPAPGFTVTGSFVPGGQIIVSRSSGSFGAKDHQQTWFYSDIEGYTTGAGLPSPWAGVVGETCKVSTERPYAGSKSIHLDWTGPTHDSGYLPVTPGTDEVYYSARWWFDQLAIAADHNVKCFVVSGALGNHAADPEIYSTFGPSVVGYNDNTGGSTAFGWNPGSVIPEQTWNRQERFMHLGTPGVADGICYIKNNQYGNFGYSGFPPGGHIASLDGSVPHTTYWGSPVQLRPPGTSELIRSVFLPHYKRSNDRYDMFVDEVYVDIGQNAQARLEVGPAAGFGTDARNRNPCPYTAWGATDITATINGGASGDLIDKALYFVSATGEVEKIGDFTVPAFVQEAGFSVVILEGNGFSDNALIRITDTTGQNRFGNKPNDPKPYLWAPIKDSVAPSPLGRLSSWSGINDLAFAAGEGADGAGALMAQSNGGTWTAQVNNVGKSWNAFGSKWYLFRKTKTNFDISSDLNWKVFRLWKGYGGSPEQNWYTASSNGNLSFEHISGGGYNIGGWPYQNVSAIRTLGGAWLTDEIIVKNNSQPTGLPDGEVYHYGNGVLAGAMPYTSYAPYYFKSNDGNGDFYQFYAVHGVKANITFPSHYRFWADDIYLDDSWCRVMVGGASLDGEKREVFIPTAWSPSQVECRVNLGEFPSLSGKHLHVVDNDNNSYRVLEFK